MRLFPKKLKLVNKVKRGLTKRIILYFMLSIAVAWGGSALLGLVVSDKILLQDEAFSAFDLLLGQIANTLIVLSLTSVLSTNIGSVYWEDIRTTKLIKPFFQCFLAQTSYLIACLVFSIVSYCISYVEGVVASFAISIILLILLTYKMVGVYFGRESIKSQLEWEYIIRHIEGQLGYYQWQKAIRDIYTDILNGRANYKPKQVKQITEMYEISRRTEQSCFQSDIAEKNWHSFSEIKNGLIEKTLQALSVGELSAVQENLDLLVKAHDYITYKKIIGSIMIMKTDYAVDLIIKYRNRFGASPSIDMSEEALNILHNSANHIYPKETYLKLLMIIRHDKEATTCYNTLVKSLNSMQQEYESKACDIKKEFMYGDNFNEMNGAVRALKESYAERVTACLEKAKDYALGNVYKPVCEMYDAYIKRDINLMNMYLDILDEDRQDIIMNIRGGVSMLSDGEHIDFLYLDRRQSEIIDMIIDMEAKEPYLPGFTLKQIKELPSLRVNANEANSCLGG